MDQIDAVTARRKANGYIGREISVVMGGRETTLVSVDGRPVWRVTIILTAPSYGQIGVVGTLDVDAHTGELLIPPDLEETIIANANLLLKELPEAPEE
jgi:hypothetical protein